jgi:hypothetical protein
MSYIHYLCNMFSITFLESTRLDFVLELFYSISIPDARVRQLENGSRSITFTCKGGEHVICFFSYTTENPCIVFPTSALLPLFGMSASFIVSRLSQVPQTSRLSQCGGGKPHPSNPFLNVRPSYCFSHDDMLIDLRKNANTSIKEHLCSWQ